MDKIKLYRPVPDEFRISSPFGFRIDPITKVEGKHHNGIDFATPEKTQVIAMASGPIVRAGFQNPADQSVGFGLRITQEINIEGLSYYLVYAHLSEIWVQVGQNIMAGKLVGLTGNTGRSSGPHIHVEARKRDSGEFSDIEFVNFATNEGAT